MQEAHHLYEEYVAYAGGPRRVGGTGNVGSEFRDMDAVESSPGMRLVQEYG